MSRSYKKFPIIRQEKENYRYLNRQLRHDKLAEIPKGSSYKKFKRKCSDWAYRWSWEDAKVTYQKRRHISDMYTIDEWYECWRRWTIRK